VQLFDCNEPTKTYGWEYAELQISKSGRECAVDGYRSEEMSRTRTDLFKPPTHDDHSLQNGMDDADGLDAERKWITTEPKLSKNLQTRGESTSNWWRHDGDGVAILISFLPRERF